MGIVVGTIFRLIINRKKKLQFSLILASLGVALAVLTTLVIIFYNIDLISFSKSITKTTLYISIVVFFGYLFSILLVLAGVFSVKLKSVTKAVMFATTISVIVNIVLEFIWKLFYNMWVEMLAVKPALIKGISTMPSCILTGSLTVVIISLIYYRVYLATKNLNHINDIDVEEYLKEVEDCE